MRPSTTAASVGVGLLLLAWLASAVGVPQAPPASRRPTPPSPNAQIDSLRSDLQRQSSRLRERMAAAPAPRPADRNPFSFDRREPARPRSAPASAETAGAPSPVAPAETEAVLVLIGVAEKKTDAGIVRTAILADAANEVYLVTEGEEVAGGYRVRLVAANAVELERVATGEIRRLHLQ